MKAITARLTIALVVIAFALALGVTAFAADQMTHTTSKFQGAKANQGTVTHSIRNGQSVLTLSDDFVVPDTPDPHWQLVDSNGKVYLLDKLMLKGDRVKKEINIPSYVPNRGQDPDLVRVGRGQPGRGFVQLAGEITVHWKSPRPDVNQLRARLCRSDP